MAWPASDSTAFWLGLGSAVSVTGGILLGIGDSRTAATASLWGSAWFDGGLAVVVCGGLCLFWAIAIYVRLRHPAPMEASVAAITVVGGHGHLIGGIRAYGMPVLDIHGSSGQVAEDNETRAVRARFPLPKQIEGQLFGPGDFDVVRTVEGRRFIGCQFSKLTLHLPGSHVSRSRFQFARFEASLLHELPAERVTLVNCTLDECELTECVFVGTEQQIESLKASTSPDL